MAAGMTLALPAGREHGSGSKRSFPRRISARCRCLMSPACKPMVINRRSASRSSTHPGSSPVETRVRLIDKNQEASVSFQRGSTGANMDNTTLLIIIVLVLLLFGGAAVVAEAAGGDLSVNDGRRHPRRFRSARSRFSR